VPATPSQLLQQQQTYPNSVSNNYQVPVNGIFDYTSLGGILRTLALLGAISLIVYVAYRRIERSRKAKHQHQQQQKI
jgi:O-antigen ligase